MILHDLPLRTMMAALVTATLPASAQPSVITVDPGCTRSIGGVAELRRTTYFGLCDHGRDFDRRCRSAERYEYLIHDNRVSFGRKLGVVTGPARWSKAVREDEKRPGFVDLAFLKRRLLELGHAPPSERFRRDVGGKLEIAAHGHHNAFPAFMGRWSTPQAQRDEKPQTIPDNIEAAAEFSAAALRDDYIDFDRPSFYEPVNEPHWSFPSQQHFQRWHLATMEAVHRTVPGVQVGGPCLPVSYFYGRQYRSFAGLQEFIDGTRGALDFYSFHSYDYLRAVDGDFGGRISSGPPLESVIDLIADYMRTQYDRDAHLVLSEHGGYGAGDLVEQLARQHFPGDGFDWEMRKRSIDDFNMVSSALANTLVFIDHPHVVVKAVPFILLESMGWDPRYYAVLYTPRNFTDKSDWVATKKILFYRFLRDLDGRRVDAECADPDLQVRAFVNQRTLFVVINNLCGQPQGVRLRLPAPRRILLRRLGRGANFTPYLTETPVDAVDELRLAGREAVLVKAEYDGPVTERVRVDERPCYGDVIVVPVENSVDIHVSVPSPSRLAYAVLRVGISRPAGTDRRASVALNGRLLPSQVQDGAARFEDEKQGFATCLSYRLRPQDVRKSNTVTVSFPDGNEGSVGAVVIRAAVWEAGE